MARRGSFGTFNAGSSNLSATIESLVRQQMAAEEQVLLNAFYNGTSYNGSIPTMATITAFYSRLADLSGIQPGTTDWDALMQKVGAANNYDIKREYNSLLTEFNNSNGANYSELSDFLKTRAQDSTDPQDAQAYQNAIGDINKSYIGYQGQALGRGEITAAEYRSLTTDILNQMDPEDPKRYEPLVDSYTYEWNAEKSKWDNRLTAGTVSASQYAAWAKGFQNALISAGVSKDSDLYTAAVAAVAVAQNRGGGGGAASVTSTRLDKTLNDLSSVFSLAQTQIGGVNIGVGDIMGDPKDVLKKLRENPDLMGLYAEWLDDNKSMIDPALRALKITDGASFRQWFEDTLDSGLTDAQTIEAAGGRANFDDWVGAATTNGSLTTFDEFAVTSSKHAKDVANSNGNDTMIQFYDDEYKKFLGGEKSYYGQRPAIEGLYPQQFAVVQNEANAMSGSYTEGALTLTGALNNGEPTWSNVQLTIDNAAAISSGQAVMVWNKESGSFTTEDPRAANAKQGSYQYVSFTVLPNGTKVPSVISVTGKKIVDSNGVDNGWIYELPTGKTYAVDAQGSAYEVTSAVPVAREGYSVDDFAKIGTRVADGLPLIDTTPLVRQGVNLGAFNPEDREARRAALTQFGVDAADLEAASALALQVAGALDPESQNRIQSASQTLAGEAVNIRAGQLEATATSADQLAEAARIRNKPEAAAYNTYVKPNMDKYEEVAKGLFRLKDTTARQTAQEQNKYMAMGGQIAGNRFDLGGQADLPTVVDLRPEFVKSSERERDVTAAERIFAGYGVKSTQTPSDSFFRNMPTTKKQQYGVLPPALPMAAMPKPVVAPVVPAPRTPDIMPPVMPKAPVAPQRPPILPPSRGGGVRKL